MADNSNKKEAKMKNDAMDDLLRFVTPIASDFAHRCVTWSLFLSGFNLQKHAKVMGSLATARSAAMSYAVSGGVFGLVETFMTKLRGKDDYLNTGLAGCCAGLIHTPSFNGVEIPRILNCVLLGGAGMFNFYIHTRPPEFYTPEKIDFGEVTATTFDRICKYRPPECTLSSCLKIVAENIYITVILGIAAGCAIDPERLEIVPIHSFKDACSFTKVSAIATGIFGHSLLLHKKLHGITDGLNAAVFGFVASLFIPQSYGSRKDFFLRCLGTGAISLSLHRMFMYGPYFPHLPLVQEELKQAGILPPFTLALPKSMEDGFSSFLKSLKNG